jgi:hypothetical protein
LTDTASIDGDQFDPNLTNNTSTLVTTLNHNPICTAVNGGPNLWSPNHKMHLITLTGATDPDGDVVTLAVTGVTQDEPLNGLRDGDTSPDATPGPASNKVNLRAERSGTGDGRASIASGSAEATDGVAVARVRRPWASRTTKARARSPSIRAAYPRSAGTAQSHFSPD